MSKRGSVIGNRIPKHGRGHITQDCVGHCKVFAISQCEMKAFKGFWAKTGQGPIYLLTAFLWLLCLNESGDRGTGADAGESIRKRLS